MPILAKYEECTGCSACASACPKSCIEMKEDISGFLYPEVNREQCIECNICEMACPVKNKQDVELITQDVWYYIAQNRDSEILRESASGGAFTALAITVIKRGGIVFGAELSADFKVRHTYCREIQELRKFRDSKYVQSEIGTSYIDAKHFLEEGYWVLFSGTPCQIAGLIGFLKKAYDKLVLVDIVCHAIPSPAVWEKYVELCQKRFAKIRQITFRDKGYGYSYSTMAVYGEDQIGREKIYRRGLESDEWLRVFFNKYCDRDSCFRCKFQTGKRNADVTLWDCFDVYDTAKELDNNRGASNIILWSNKAKEIFDSAKEILHYKELPFDCSMPVLYRKEISYPNIDRGNFYEDLRNMSAEQFFKKYSPNSMGTLAKEKGRKALVIMHVHDIVRKAVHYIRKRRR